MKKIYVSQILVIISASIVFISTILPVEVISGRNINLIYLDGKIGPGVIIMILSVIAAIFAILMKKTPMMIAVILNFIIVFLKLDSFTKHTNNRAIGFYLLLIGSLLLVISAIFMVMNLDKTR